MLPFVLGGLAAAQGIAGIIAGSRQAKKLNRMVDAAGVYEADPMVAQQVALAQNLFNGRMAGASAAEQNILGNQSNALAGVGRNATDSSKALSVLAGLQGNTNASLAGLAQQEAEDKMQRQSMVRAAVGDNAAEKQREHADKLRQMEQRMQIQATKSANIQNGIGQIAGGIGMATGGLRGGLGALGGGAAAGSSMGMPNMSGLSGILGQGGMLGQQVGGYQPSMPGVNYIPWSINR